jgi:hypothetical protein
MKTAGTGPTGYFSFKELGIMALLAFLEMLTGTFALQYFLSGTDTSGFVYGALGLPGPGAGVLVFGSILCFWLMLGLLAVKKTGTAIVLSVMVMAFDLTIGGQIITLQSLDVILIAAVIIEVLALLPSNKSPVNSTMPVLMAVLGVFTLGLAVTGQARMGEEGVPVAGFPIGYVTIGTVALCYALICYRYPVTWFAAGACANMYYVLHFWLFWGTSFAGRFPVSPELIPVLFCVAAVGGVIAATGAYGIDRFRARSTGRS